MSINLVDEKESSGLKARAAGARRRQTTPAENVGAPTFGVRRLPANSPSTECSDDGGLAAVPDTQKPRASSRAPKFAGSAEPRLSAGRHFEVRRLASAFAIARNAALRPVCAAPCRTLPPRSPPQIGGHAPHRRRVSSRTPRPMRRHFSSALPLFLPKKSSPSLRHSPACGN